MLQISTIHPSTLELLVKLQSLELLKSTRLVGGTALALLLGHRQSIDLDIFGEIDADTETITNCLTEEGLHVGLSGNSKNIHVFTINGVKTDIVNYPFAWLEDVIVEHKIRLAGLKDIASMKIAAITNRGSKKDFIDLYFLLHHFSLNELMDFYLTKYPSGSSFLAYKSLTYFVDADGQVMPKMLVPTDWNDVKKRVINEVKKA